MAVFTLSGYGGTDGEEILQRLADEVRALLVAQGVRLSPLAGNLLPAFLRRGPARASSSLHVSFWAKADAWCPFCQVSRKVLSASVTVCLLNVFPLGQPFLLPFGHRVWAAAACGAVLWSFCVASFR